MKKQNKLGTYLALTAGVGCVTSASAATVIFYGVDSANDTNADPRGISIYSNGSNNYFGLGGADANYLDVAFGVEDNTFTNGSDLTFDSSDQYTGYTDDGGFTVGAASGDANYVNLSFNGPDDVFEAVAQFNFDGMGGGFLVAIAFADGTTLDDGTTLLTADNAPTDLSTLTNTGTESLSISASAAAISAASVPEPSCLALLALGASGLMTRRNRKLAA